MENHEWNYKVSDHSDVHNVKIIKESFIVF